ncbi:hypothetical protein LEP1GSC036_2671 [Leptospira weilii str. 2006001853]|uniref:Uncharacterized protein n=1 Tax=Leptospira weilii str. 2006001853 TaxID=1001589 RepID=A0A828Z4T5_9LEPT|nr:hypothetical protein LEP1GSC036_2671 [Leptospira weilii str. 2006001853]EMN45020.1 hypothetical protein LEP1GSC086_2725 [Leptospira weilii str. LNT 1234]
MRYMRITPASNTTAAGSSGDLGTFPFSRSSLLLRSDPGSVRPSSSAANSCRLILKSAAVGVIVGVPRNRAIHRERDCQRAAKRCEWFPTKLEKRAIHRERDCQRAAKRCEWFPTKLEKRAIHRERDCQRAAKRCEWFPTKLEKRATTSMLQKASEVLQNLRTTIRVFLLTSRVPFFQKVIFIVSAILEASD